MLACYMSCCPGLVTSGPAIYPPVLLLSTACGRGSLGLGITCGQPNVTVVLQCRHLLDTCTLQMSSSLPCDTCHTVTYVTLLDTCTVQLVKQAPCDTCHTRNLPHLLDNRMLQLCNNVVTYLTSSLDGQVPGRGRPETRVGGYIYPRAWDTRRACQVGERIVTQLLHNRHTTVTKNLANLRDFPCGVRTV